MPTITTSKEQEALYQFLLQQVAAESYIETKDDWLNPVAVRTLLNLGANREDSTKSGHQPGHTRLTSQQIAEFHASAGSGLAFCPPVT
jgi:hypothetical protein